MRAPLADVRELTVSVGVLLAKLALELALVLAWAVRGGQLTIFGKPVVFRSTAPEVPPPTGSRAPRRAR